jgi:hypothetical protein
MCGRPPSDGFPRPGAYGAARRCRRPRALGDRVSFADLAAAKQRTPTDEVVSRRHFTSELSTVLSRRRSRSSGPSMKATTWLCASGGSCESPRAVFNALTALSGLVRSGTLLIDGKWAPAVRSIVELNRAIRHAAERESRRRRR